MTGSSNSPDQLKWIEEKPSKTAVQRDFYEPAQLEQRNFKNTVLKKSMDNILVPLGLLATTFCLVMGLVNLKRGDSHKQQLFMRGRVGFQTFTLAAMATGMYFSGRKKREKIEK